MDLDGVHMLAKNYYVLSRQHHLTEERMEEIEAAVARIRPEIPVLVVVMKKSNVKEYPDLVREVPIL